MNRALTSGWSVGARFIAPVSLSVAPERGLGGEVNSERQQAAPGRHVHGLGAALSIQLSQDRRDVELDRVVGDAQPLGYRLVGQPDRYQRQHFPLAPRQLVDFT